jgi:NitT/TauT family transport system permease protein
MMGAAPGEGTLTALAAPVSAAGALGRPTSWTPERVFLFVSPLTLLALWELLADAGVLDVRIFSSPSRVVVLAWQMALDGSLFVDTGATLARFAAGTLLGALPGLALGLTMGLFRWPRAILNPLVATIYPLPRIAIFPLVLLVVGLNETSNVLMIAISPFFYMLIGTMGAVMNVDPVHLKVARSFKVSMPDLYRLVVLPAALPIIFSSLRLSLGGGLLITIAIESLVARDGLGFLVWHSWQTLSLGGAMVGLVVSGVLGFVMILALDGVERRWLPWSAAGRSGGAR